MTTDDEKDIKSCVEEAKAWSIEGKDLLSVVSCKEPYEWSDATNYNWEFSKSYLNIKNNNAKNHQYHVILKLTKTN